MSNEIIFPITLDYVSGWGAYQVVRELVQNALDSDPGFKMGMDKPSTLWIEDSGDGLVIRHLLLGVSEKSANSRGQFGEGLKLALLVLTREGLTAHIYSGNRHLWNEPAEMEGEQVFKVVWETGVGSPVRGTRIEIPNWPYELFEDRFLRPGDPRIIFTDPFGRSILEQDNPDIFVKGIWVQKAKGYGKGYVFGYNLTDVEMNRDRGVVDDWKVSGEIGKIWASVTDTTLLERFWQAVKDNCAEHGCRMHGTQIGSKKSLAQAFKAVFGKNAVIQTGEAAAREAEYRGANALTTDQVGYGFKDTLADIIGTDAQYTAEMEGGSEKYIPDKRLAEASLKRLKKLRRLAKRLAFAGKIMAYVLPRDVGGQTYKEDIRISLEILGGKDEEAIAVLIHEMAHAEYKTSDATAGHADAIALVGARLVASYACRR